MIKLECKERLLITLSGVLLISPVVQSCASNKEAWKGESPSWFSQLSIQEAKKETSTASNEYLLQYVDLALDANEEDKNKKKIIEDFGKALGVYAGVFELEGIDKTSSIRAFHRVQMQIGTDFESYQSPFVIIYKKGIPAEIYSFSRITDNCLEDLLARSARRIYQNRPVEDVLEDEGMLPSKNNEVCSLVEKAEVSKHNVVKFVEYIVDNIVQVMSK